MTTVRTVIHDRRIDVPAPDDLPDGTERQKTGAFWPDCDEWSRSTQTSRGLTPPFNRRRARSFEFLLKSTITVMTLKNSPRKNHNHALLPVFCAQSSRAPRRLPG